MNSITVTNLIIDSTTNYGTALLTILGAVLVIGVGMLVFKWGWNYFNLDIISQMGGIKKWKRIKGGWRME